MYWLLNSDNAWLEISTAFSDFRLFFDEVRSFERPEDQKRAIDKKRIIGKVRDLYLFTIGDQF